MCFWCSSQFFLSQISALKLTFTNSGIRGLGLKVPKTIPCNFPRKQQEISVCNSSDLNWIHRVYRQFCGIPGTRKKAVEISWKLPPQKNGILPKGMPAKVRKELRNYLNYRILSTEIIHIHSDHSLFSKGYRGFSKSLHISLSIQSKWNGC